MPTLPNSFNPMPWLAPLKGGGAAGGSSTMAIPLAAMLALSAGSGFLNNLLGNKSRKDNEKKTRAHELELAKMDDSRARDLADLEILNEESMADPFRQILQQIQAASLMDKMARVDPLKINPTGGQIGRYSVPSFTGGMLSYDADPEMRAAATAARSAVLQGQGQAPSVVTRTAPPVGQPGAPNPRSGALNLLAGRAPAQTPVSTTMPVSSPLPAGAGVSFDPMALPQVQPTVPDDFRLSLDDLMAPPAPSRQAPRRRRRMAA